MVNPNRSLLAELEEGLRRSRVRRASLANDLVGLKAEIDGVRAELCEVEMLISQTTSSIYRLISSTLKSRLRDDNSRGSLETLLPENVRSDLRSEQRSYSEESARLSNRTISQAVTLLLTEEGGPLHVNIIYDRLVKGGFHFSGSNPTISIAGSLNRNAKFRRSAPNTFELSTRKSVLQIARAKNY